MEYITLTKDDPEFDSYLRGTFSKTLRALPIETYHPDSTRERVTFQVLPVSKIEKPSWINIYLLSCRPELLVLTLGPAVAAWLNGRDLVADWTPWPSWFALLGVFFLHTAVFLLNDVQDHLNGHDRLNRRRGSQVIQKGWVSTTEMQRWSWVNFALAILFGVPAFLNEPLGLAAICLLAMLALYVVVQNSWARWGVSDFAIGALFGPLLVGGVTLASFSNLNESVLYLGLAFGIMTVWTLQVRQFENLFRSKPEGFRTFLGYVEFDRARFIVVFFGGVILFLQPMLAYILAVPFKLFLLLPLVATPFILLLARLHRAASPLSSSLVNCETWALRAQMAWTAWWILAFGVQWL